MRRLAQTEEPSATQSPRSIGMEVGQKAKSGIMEAPSRKKRNGCVGPVHAHLRNDAGSMVVPAHFSHACHRRPPRGCTALREGMLSS